jgi:DNA (cytosine-5)-methyltransferase 1
MLCCGEESDPGVTVQRKLLAVSLFSGAGGLDLGVESAGYSVVYVVENDPAAVATLSRSRAKFFPDLLELQPQDITTLEPSRVMNEIGVASGDIDLLVGGPPCVAFSKSGFHLEYKREGRDPRAGLLNDYVRFLEALRPRAFIMENVFGLAYRNQSTPVFQALINRIRGFGYSINYKVLNASDYGVPQNRQRLFVIGDREGLTLHHPVPTHWGDHERRVRPRNADALLPHVTAREALTGLHTDPEPDERVNGKYGHLLPEIPPGGNYLHYTEHAGHPQPLFGWRSRYWTFLLKLDPDRPASTIQAQPGPYVGPFHWENRRLRIPELKRLQGFPDDYELVGTRREIQVQIGNSVPPQLGYVVADAVRCQVMGEDSPAVADEPIQAALPLLV